jgi:LCP family protein required for cell wall assembly
MRRATLPPELDPRCPRRRIRTPLGRVSLGTLAMLSLLVLGISSIGWVAFRQFSGALTRLDMDIDGDRPAQRAGELNILLLGDDSRDGTNGEFGEVQGVRSDTTIIAHLGADGRATLVSFPRDTLLTVTPRAAGTPADGRDKLTNIITYAGVQGLITTLENLTDLKINHFVSIDLAGFRTMTEAVGGVTVCVKPLPDGSTRNLKDRKSGWHGQLGENQLGGDQALAFVRSRESLGDERLRIARQQQFLSKLLQKATSAGVLTNPVRLRELLKAVGESLKVDGGLDDEKMIDLAQRVSRLDGIEFITVPTHVPTRAEGASDDFGTIGSHGNVLVYEPTGLEKVLEPLRPTPTGDRQVDAPAPRPTLTPGQVNVAEIVNGTGRSGLAADTAADLSALGFGGALAAESGNASPMASEVRYPPGQEMAANTLAGVIPGAMPIPDQRLRGDGIRLVLGTSFSGVAGGSAGAGSAGSAFTVGVPAGTGAAPGSAALAVPATPAPTTPADTSCTA